MFGYSVPGPTSLLEVVSPRMAVDEVLAGAAGDRDLIEAGVGGLDAGQRQGGTGGGEIGAVKLPLVAQRGRAGGDDVEGYVCARGNRLALRRIQNHLCGGGWKDSADQAGEGEGAKRA
jgi:hypothetical protein